MVRHIIFLSRTQTLDMNKGNMLQGIKKVQPNFIRPVHVSVAIAVLLCVLMTLAWYLILNPLQVQLEARLRNYPRQLTSLQELNRTLLIYKSKELTTPKIAEAEFANLKAKLLAQGLQFNVMRLDRASPAQISMQLNEIEFSRWLELIEDFRKNNGLYASDVSIKKNSNNPGTVQVTATLVQAP